tara:strand:+ start:829 stop:2076 length:1248 start_codon:yes stop_codon:yes gene_type:complete
MANEFKVKKGLVVDGTNTVLDIQGTLGQLFSITDSLTGDLFSVSDVSGIPILNVNSSGSITLDGTVDSSIIMPTIGSQIKIGTFTNGGNNSGEYANDDLVIGDGSISINPHRRGDYALNETATTSTTFRSKLNIWSDAEDHITFGGASTQMRSAWEGFKIWINNDSSAAGTLYLYNKGTKVEFARFSGDATTSFITGKFYVNGELEATSLDINGAADISGNLTGVDSLYASAFSGSGTYHEFGNGIDNVSNDGSWNGRLNVAGLAHARLDVKTTGDGIITSMYSHNGHATGKVGTMSDHSLTFMCNGNNKGSITTGGTLTMIGDVVAYSDIKLKENIKTLDGSKVLKMRGVSFDRIDTGVSSSGVIAQEMQEVAPELVNETDGTLGVAYGNITGYLIEAIKDLKLEIDELKKQIK